MSSLMWYIYDFARKAWADAFTNAKSLPELAEKPERFRNFPQVNKEYCIGCGACTVSCPSPNAIKIIREKDDETGEGLTYPVIYPGACIRCGFCAEVCPTDPKTLECGENHLIMPEFNIIPSKRQYIVDDYLCIKCKKCMKQCPVGAISLVNDKLHVQVYYEDILKYDNHGYIYLSEAEGNKVLSEYSTAFWDEEKQGGYEEYIFNISTDMLEKYKVYGHFFICQNLVEGDWKVRVRIE